MKNKRGFTLIEIIIALTLLIVIIPAFTGAILSSLSNEEDMDQRLRANRISNSIIEILKSDKYKSKLDESELEWNEKDSFFSDYIIKFKDNKDNENSDTDISIEIKSTSTDDLYNVIIDWKNINYRLETLIAGEDNNE